MDVKFATIEGTSGRFRAAVAVLAALVLAGGVSTYLMYAHGLFLSGMTNRVPWGLQIAMAIYYIGLSAGSLVVSGLYGIFGRTEYKPFARVAAYLAMLFLMAGLLSIATDQGRIDRLLVQPFSHVNPSSMFSWNPALYSGHIMVCIVYLWALLKEKARMTKVLSLVAVLWAVGTHTGTGAIFALVPRELYNSPLLPPAFVAAALSSGAALMILVMVAVFRATGRHLDDDIVIWLGHRLLPVLLLTALYLMAIENLYRVYQAGSREAGTFFLFGGFHSVLFWGGLIVLGSIVPAVLLLRRKTGTSVRWVVFASTLVVLGILCERYLIVVPGLQHPPDLLPGFEITRSAIEEGVARYGVSVYEFLQASGVAAFVGLAFLLGLRFLKLLPTEARWPAAAAASSTAPPK
jgi:molybdopterin-containing oxidoreductase family membrane subunit